LLLRAGGRIGGVLEGVLSSSLLCARVPRQGARGALQGIALAAQPHLGFIVDKQLPVTGYGFPN
jgi:hypothetical protein